MFLLCLLSRVVYVGYWFVMASQFTFNYHVVHCLVSFLQVGFFGRSLQASSQPNSSSFVIVHICTTKIFVRCLVSSLQIGFFGSSLQASSQSNSSSFAIMHQLHCTK
jgi:hypothetical protein